MEELKTLAFVAFLVVGMGCLVSLTRSAREVMKRLGRAADAQADYWEREEDDGDWWKRGERA